MSSQDRRAIALVSDGINTWLIGKAAETASSSLLEAGLQLLVGLPVLFGTFWLILTFLYKAHVSSRLPLTLSLAAVIVLFLLSAGTDRGQIENRSTLRLGGPSMNDGRTGSSAP